MRAPTLPALVLVGACVNHVTPTRVDPSSFQVTILCADEGAPGGACGTVPHGVTDCSTLNLPDTPLNLGTPTSSVPDSQVHYVVQAVAYGNNGQMYTPYSGKAGVYAMFQGSVSPPRMPQSDTPQPGGQQLPLTLDDSTNWAQFTGGKACFGVSLKQASMPNAFGHTVIWVEDQSYSYYDPGVPHGSGQPGKRDISGSFAVGGSQQIYRRQPLISDIQYTTDKIYTNSPLTNKYVNIATGTNGAPIVVTSVYSTYFTVTDLGTPGEDHAWGSLDVYSYSQPLGLEVGSVVSNITGSVSPYDGLTELSFPLWTVVSASPNPYVPLPAPHEVKGSDIPQTLTRMKPWESALVVLKSPTTGPGWTVCNLQANPSLLESYNKYQEWAVQPPPPDGCSPSDTSPSCLVDCNNWQQSIEIVSNQTVPNFNPLDANNNGKKFCALTGVMTHVVPAAGVQLWVVNPRSPADLGIAVDPNQPCPE